MKKVSVIVPVYNAEEYIDRCMECLFNQTLEDMEIIAVDDHSTDGSAQLLEAWQKKYPEKLLVRHSDRNMGPGGARNEGIVLSSGSYLGFMDCDDIVERTMYEKLYQCAAEGDYDITDCGFLDEAGGRTVITYTDEVTGRLDGGKKSELLARGGYVWSKLFRKSLLTEHHIFFRENVIYEDLDFLIRAEAFAGSAGNVMEVLYHYKNNAGSAMKSGKEQKSFQDAMDAVDAIYKELSGLEFYESIREAAEYNMIRMYCLGINLCLLNQDNAAFDMNHNLRRLKKTGAGKWAAPASNRFCLRYMNGEEMEIMDWFGKLKF